MRILILGGTGFIGRNMIERFSSEHQVVAVDHIKPRFDHDDVKWICADLRKPFDFTGYDVVIHAAATTSGSKDIVNTPAIHVTDNAIMGSLIFRACAEAGVKHVIFFSCTTMWSTGVCKEETPIDIHPKYFGVAHTKMYLEKLCEFYSGKTKFTAIRHSNIYGPHDKFDLQKSHVFGATVTKVMTQDKVTIWGNGEEQRDLLYIDDLCDFVEMAIENQPSSFGLYNCGSSVGQSVNELVARIAAASGKDPVIEYDLSAPTIPVSLVLDCTKAKEELGWEPKTTLYEGIEKTLEWYRANTI